MGGGEETKGSTLPRVGLCSYVLKRMHALYADLPKHLQVGLGSGMAKSSATWVKIDVVAPSPSRNLLS